MQMERVRIRLLLNMDLVAQKLNGLPRLKVIKAISGLLGREVFKAYKVPREMPAQMVILPSEARITGLQQTSRRS